jgi:3-oxoacyl-[acyl-carrier-protein] synthase II
MNEKDAIVVTGTGVFSSIGCRRKIFWQSLISGVSRVRKISTFNFDGHKSRIASEIQSFNPTDYIPLKHSIKMARVSQFASSAAVEAVKDAGLDLAKESPERVGCVSGSTAGAWHTIENKDPDCDIDIVANEARDHKLKAAISNSFGFGRQNAVLAFSKVN